MLYMWDIGKQKLDSFLNELNHFHPNLSLTNKTWTERVNLKFRKHKGKRFSNKRNTKKFYFFEKRGNLFIVL